MTQQEFQERVKMTVCAEEYDAIETVYLMSDLNKDDFCKMWVQMNKSRVERAIKEAKARKEAMDNKERAYKIFNKLQVLINKKSDNFFCYTHLLLGARDLQFLHRLFGFEVDEMSGGSLKFKLGQFVGIY